MFGHNVRPKIRFRRTWADFGWTNSDDRPLFAALRNTRTYSASETSFSYRALQKHICSAQNISFVPKETYSFVPKKTQVSLQPVVQEMLFYSLRRTIAWQNSVLQQSNRSIAEKRCYSTISHDVLCSTFQIDGIFPDERKQNDNTNVRTVLKRYKGLF